MNSFDWEIACLSPSSDPCAMSITEIIFWRMFGDKVMF